MNGNTAPFALSPFHPSPFPPFTLHPFPLSPFHPSPFYPFTARTCRAEEERGGEEGEAERVIQARKRPVQDAKFFQNVHKLRPNPYQRPNQYRSFEEEEKEEEERV